VKGLIFQPRYNVYTLFPLYPSLKQTSIMFAALGLTSNLIAPYLSNIKGLSCSEDICWLTSATNNHSHISLQPFWL